MTDSWWLKVKRAQKHMVDIKREAVRYTNTHPYEFIPIRQPYREHNIRHRLRIVQDPDPVLALMLGDFVHNLRCALDHIIVACVPKCDRSETTSFPMSFVDLFAKDPNGDFVSNDAKARENFKRSIGGLHPDARTIVIRAQPYNAGSEAGRWTLGIISRLDNTDKHRALTTFGRGMKNVTADIMIGDQPASVIYSMRWTEFAENDAIVEWRPPLDWKTQGFPRPSEMQMRHTGTVVIHIKMTDVGGKKTTYKFPLYLTMLNAIKDVRRILRLLEPFVIR
jgi:hypothetical protein